MSDEPKMSESDIKNAMRMLGSWEKKMRRHAIKKLMVPITLVWVFLTAVTIIAMIEVTGKRALVTINWIWLTMAYMIGSFCMAVWTLVISARGIKEGKAHAFHPSHYRPFLAFAVMAFLLGLLSFVLLEIINANWATNLISNWDNFNYLPAADAADVAYSTSRLGMSFIGVMNMIIASWFCLSLIIILLWHGSRYPYFDHTGYKSRAEKERAASTELTETD